MNTRNYFEARFFPNPLEDSNDIKARDRILNEDGGAEDGCTVGDILAEMPLDSPCGLDCKIAIDSCSLFLDSVARAHGVDHYRDVEILEKVADICCTFIRG